MRTKSPLVAFEDFSPNHTSPRRGKIRRLTPHCVAGNLTTEAILNLTSFKNYSPKTGASCTYAIGSNGRLGQGVSEGDRPWTSSTGLNDHEAITFEIANVTGSPDWRMSDEAINAWLDLSVDICRFYGYKEVKYQEKPTTISGISNVEKWIKTWSGPDDMIITLHNWYANKACPGPYFMRQLPWLVGEINKRLSDEAYVPEIFVGELVFTPVLKTGSKGAQVARAQQLLNGHGPEETLVIDGSFGPATRKAVRYFQTMKGLQIDGVVGPKTWEALLAKPETNEDVFEPYLIRIAVRALNVRSGPGLNHAVSHVLINDPNVYTIVEEEGTSEVSRWGKLKSGAGWVLLAHTVRV